MWLAHEVGRGVLEVPFLPGFDWLAHMGGEECFQETSLETSSGEMAWLSTSLAQAPAEQPHQQ